LPRLPKKKWKLEERIRTKAQLEAEAKFKLSELGLTHEMKTALFNMINKIDPIELAAVGATTVVVNNTISGITEFKDSATQIIENKIGNLTPDAIFEYLMDSVGLGIPADYLLGAKKWIYERFIEVSKGGGAGRR